MSNSELRAKAREQLKGNIFGETWLLALVVCLIEGAVLSAASSIAGIGVILVLGAISVGVSGLFLSLARGKDSIEIGDMFQGFTSDFGGNLLLGLLSSLFIALWSLLFIIPGIVKTYSYSMCFYIKNDHPEYDWKACIDGSREMMDGHKWKLFCLDLSFIGWYIVGALCFGIGTLWVVPYHEAARANFYEAIVSEAI